MSRNIRWFLDELPVLEEAGIVDADAAERLKSHYQTRLSEAPAIGRIIISILGATLIGLGIILLVGHNWSEFSRDTRTIISFLPLFLGQILVLFGLNRAPQSVAWREGSCVFLTLAIGASIGLIEQTWHLSSRDYAGYLLIWSLLALPLLYIPGSLTACLLYWAAIVLWTFQAQTQLGHAVWFWPLFAASLPFVWRQLQQKQSGRSAALLAHTCLLTLLVGGARAMEHSLTHQTLLLCAGLAATLCMAAAALPNLPAVVGRASARFGVVGTVLLALYLTYEESWGGAMNSERYHGDLYSWYQPAWAVTVDLVIYLAVIALAGLLLLRLLIQRQGYPLLWGGILPLAFLTQYSPDSMAAVLHLATNAYTLILGLVTLRTGLKTGNNARLNGGLGILFLLICARFFDWDLSFMLRGVLFILTGAVFLFVNWRLKRQVAS